MPDQTGVAKLDRVVCYCLMGIVSPAILFAFALLFGEDSYQWWGDRFHLELTNRYLFSRVESDSLLGALWREDILGGSPWATNIGPAPVALVVLSARFFKLSPFGIDLVGTVTLYFTAVASMYVYLRRAMLLSIESATAGSVMFAGTAYWVSHLVGNPDLPMAIACLPALLFMTHQIQWATERRSGNRVLLHLAGFAILFFAFAIHSTLASFPITLLLVLVYAWSVFGVGRAFWWCLVAVGIGCVLYSPFAWSVVGATRYSSRFDGLIFFDGQPSPLAPSTWWSEARLIATRLALGHSAYGLYLVGLLGFAIWWALRQDREPEPARVKRILRFAAWAAVIIPSIEVFHLAIDYLKREIPLVGGWSVSRFQYASPFALVALVAWMLDRSLFRLGHQPLTLRQRRAVRTALMITGIIGFGQIGYSAYRMSQVPKSIYPQNLVLYAGLFLYTTTVFALLVWLYRHTRKPVISSNTGGADFRCAGLVTLIVLAVSLTTSVHAYRQGVVGMRGADMNVEHDRIMTYQERYAVPEDIRAMRQLNVSDGRVVDLTRPIVNTPVGPMGDAPLVSLGGLRTPSGYSAVYPSWYERFIYVAIDGVPAGPRTIVEVRDTGQANFEALGLLDVEYILAPEGLPLPGYAPVPGFLAQGKTLWAPLEVGRVAPAFVSPGVRCFATDGEALNFLHRSTLRELQTRAILVSRDDTVATLCNGKQNEEAEDTAGPVRVRTNRGIDRVTVAVESSGGGILTLSDTYDPGWKVFVDGVEKPLLRTYTTLRGVVIGPGRQSVEFVYEPGAFWALLRLSGATLVVLLLAAFVAGILELMAKRFGRIKPEGSNLKRVRP